MAPYYPPIKPSVLLPPLLACLPIAFVSTRPPPALLDLLSPVLRQRVKALSETSDVFTEQDGSSWLSLLCWEPGPAARLTSIVEAGTFEPHPVSGEIELGELAVPDYRRLDEETLQSCLRLKDLGLQVIYVWCNDGTEGMGPGWQLAELQPLDTSSFPHPQNWCPSIEEATEKFRDSHARSLGGRLPSPPSIRHGNERFSPGNEDEDEDDAYWAQYDDTPARTPATKRSPAGDLDSSPTHNKVTREIDYFDRYSQVQPAMDGDVSPTDGETREGTSHCHENTSSSIVLPPERQSRHQVQQHYGDDSNQPHSSLIHTRPSSSSPSFVPQLEHSVQCQFNSELASLAIKQHISSSMKSLFRLAKSSGIERLEFENMVKRELDVLSLFEEDD